MMIQGRVSESAELAPPFPKEYALNNDTLEVPEHPRRPSSTVSSYTVEEVSSAVYIPGEPALHLKVELVQGFLERELSTRTLDELYKHLWWFSRHSGVHIDPMNRQKMKGREIFPIEDPKLHLVWKPDVIYLKPVPECLLNYEFWQSFLSGKGQDLIVEKLACSDDPFEDHRLQALGFLRSYAFLVQHRLDFEIAQKSHLIPENINWPLWSKFMSYFRYLEDTQVSKRYRYGQIRLSRLHWAVRLFRPKSIKSWLFYEPPYWSTWGFLNSMLGPFVFVFTTLSVILSSMQLMTASDYSSLDPSHFELVKKICWAASLVVLVVSSCAWTVVFIVLPVGVLLWQLNYGLLNKKRA
jgi:hypothetical protein